MSEETKLASPEESVPSPENQTTAPPADSESAAPPVEQETAAPADAEPTPVSQDEVAEGTPPNPPHAVSSEPPAQDAAGETDQTPPAGENRPSSRIQIGSRRGGDVAPKAKPNVESTSGEESVESEKPRKSFPPPNVREQLSPELQAELDAALAGGSVEDLMDQSLDAKPATELSPESRVRGKVLRVTQEDVFFELGGRSQGTVPVRQFDTPPVEGSEFGLVVNRFNDTEGLYELSLPHKGVEVTDWSEVQEGQVVEATVTGTNKGGLECRVSGIRGFMPMGQVSIYHIQNAEEMVGQKLDAVVTEANPRRKNLVLSHRAVMERERAEKREQLLKELAPGQIRDGVVRSLRDFGAFVDLGGVDGLIHVSQLSWDRVSHPKEVLSEGQTVKVKVEKINPETGKIGLSYKDLGGNPWDEVTTKYPVGGKVKGTVSKTMDFGAFVKLEPGVEGLIHISELAHGRVFRTTDVVNEGDEVNVKILTVDTDQQRIGLSLRALQDPPKQEEKPEDEDFEPPKDAPKAPQKRRGQLKGGVGRDSGGEKFGLKW